MKRSITTCFMVCGALFLVEFGMELAVQPNNSMSHLVGVMSAQVVDLDEEKPEDPRPERKLSHPSPDWIVQLDKISTAIDDEDYESAKEILDRQVQRTGRWNERELAIFHQRYLDIALITEDFKLAIEQAGKILEYAEHLSYFIEERVLWMVATIYASDEYQDFEKALEYIQRWLDLKLDWEEGSRQYAFIGSIYTYLEDYYKVEEWMTRAIEKAEEEEIEIPEYWRMQLWQAYRQLADELIDSPTERDSYLQKAQELALFFEMMPVFKPEPDYPTDALQRGLEGYVIVQFDVTEEGTVENPVVLEAKPARIFDSSAISAALKFKYKPKIVDDQAVRVDGVKHRIQYELEEQHKPQDQRPERKLAQPTQDWMIQLEKISTAIDDEDYDSAREMLDRQVQRTRRWNERELAIFHRRYLDLALVTEDFELAIEQAGKILEYAEHVSYFVEEHVLWMVATIYASDENQDFAKALEYIQRWLDLKLDWEEGSRNYAFIGSIYAHLEDYYKVEEWMTRAIERAEEEEIEIPDYWRVQLWQAYRKLAEELKDSPAERDSYLEKAQELAQFFEMMPVFKPEPEYPIDALQQGIEGYVIVQFDVTEEGAVENPVVLESKPADTFDSSAIRAASKFKYKPKIVNDQAVRVDGVKHRIQYKIE